MKTSLEKYVEWQREYFKENKRFIHCLVQFLYFFNTSRNFNGVNIKTIMTTSSHYLCCLKITFIYEYQRTPTNIFECRRGKVSYSHLRLSLEERELEIQVRILSEAARVSLRANDLGQGMNQFHEISFWSSFTVYQPLGVI